jgi:class 3 adenylate cyclase
MFGDIAGFTAWSSTRQPTDVFILLETLYGEFDRIAREMDVFKVETVGDCYVAVTGLPNPRHDHHLRMVSDIVLLSWIMMLSSDPFLNFQLVRTLL